MPPRSKIAQMPEHVRAWLHRALVDRAFGDHAAVAAELREMLQAEGLDMQISRAAVGRESARIQRLQESIRATTEATKMIVASASDDGDSRSEATLALVQSEVFELLHQVREAGAADDPADRLDLMNKAALGLSRMARARNVQARWKDELDQRTKSAAEAVAKIARQGGLTPEQQAEIRSSILGIVRREAQPA